MEDITVEELLTKVNKKETLYILDVREEWEYEENNLGLPCKNIPLNDLPFRIEELADWKTKEIIIHCKSGKRGGQAKKYLNKQGFSQLRNLLGGLEAYLKANQN